MTKRFCSLLSGAALAALSLPLAAQEALTTITSVTPELEIAAPEAVDNRTFGERLADAGFDYRSEPATSEGLEAATSVITSGLEAESPEARGTSAVFTLPGEFLVAGWNNMNWQYDMFFGEERSFKKIIVDVDFYHGGWAGRVNNDPINYGGDYYCVFWLNAGRQWSGAIAYLNFIFPRGQLENQSNLGGYWAPDFGSFGLRLSTGCSVGQGGNYRIHYEYDAENAVQYFTLSEGGQERCVAAGFAGESPRVTASNMFIQFGSQYSPEGPEGATIGWRFSNFKVQFIGDNPIGRRPRRR